jgi:hypothetical protein
MHKLDTTRVVHIDPTQKLDARYEIFGWELIGSATDNVHTTKKTEYGYDSLSGNVVSREKENSTGINYVYFYRILEVSIRDEIISLENEYNETANIHKYNGKYLSWFFYFIKIYLPIALACMFIFAYIPLMILGMTKNPDLIVQPYEEFSPLIIMLGFAIGVIVSVLVTKREGNKANLLRNITLLKKHKDFKDIIARAEAVLKRNNNEFIEFSPYDDICFNRNFLSLKAFRRPDRGLIIPKGVTSVDMDLQLNPNNFKYVYLPKGVKHYPRVWFKTKIVKNYYSDSKLNYSKYPDHFILYEGSEKMYGYTKEEKELYTHYFDVQFEQIKDIVSKNIT